MDKWISEGLSKMLDFEVPEEMIQFVMSIENESDLNDYMKTLLDFDNDNHRNFFMELSKMKFSSKGNTGTRPKKKILKTKQPQQDFVTVDASEKEAQQKNSNVKEGKKKKTKFVNLYSQEGENAQVVMLKGRHRCDCEASKHDLVDNCLNCGRVVCTQEGSGPCLFCGELVCTTEEIQEMYANSTLDPKLIDALMERKRVKGWEEAHAQMDRLIEYERNSEKRTLVVDDDCDYFNTNSVWMTPEEREKMEKYEQEMHEKKHQSRRNKKMTFDFAGRQIIEENEIEAVDMDRIMEITEEAEAKRLEYQNERLIRESADRDLTAKVDAPVYKFQFDESVKGSAKVSRTPSVARTPSVYDRRVQDPQLQEMGDSGKCLSMHQPWASLLVEGIKLHEGRTWYTPHRGRLWIASTAKPPDQEVVRAMENQYRLSYPEKEIKFPSFYPTGCLLGCVNVDDCLPQELYQTQYPNGESDSPYVFICSYPISLRLRFPIKGQHKIYQLEKSIHEAAVKSLETMPKDEAEEISAEELPN